MPFAKFGLYVIAILTLSSCVTTPSGGKRLDPYKAAVRADGSLGDWLKAMGYPTDAPPGTY